MTTSQALLKAKQIGVRNCKNKLSSVIKSNEIFIVTEYGHPKSYILPYEDMAEIADILEEMQDKNLMRTVKEARQAIRSRKRGIPVIDVIKRVRAKRT